MKYIFDLLFYLIYIVWFFIKIIIFVILMIFILLWQFYIPIELIKEVWKGFEFQTFEFYLNICRVSKYVRNEIYFASGGIDDGGIE